jgi:hypothetical protein
MLFGKKDTDELPPAQFWLAWYPVTLKDGRVAWLHNVWCYPHHAHSRNASTGRLMPCVVWQYAENNGEQK